jgi:hypothetical protein
MQQHYNQEQKTASSMNIPLKSEDDLDLSAFADTWDQADVTAIPAVITTHFPEVLDCDRFAKTVPTELRGTRWAPNNWTTQHGFQVMAVDMKGLALVRHITLWEHEDVDHSTFSTVSLAEAQAICKTFSETTPYKADEIGHAGDYGPQAFENPCG